jgi:phospholipid/cholesterol/gamma-HCH transport system substrate-binding protein
MRSLRALQRRWARGDAGITLVETLVVMVLMTVIGTIVLRAVIDSHKLVRVTNDQAEVLGSVGSNLRQGSDVLAKAASNFQTTLGRVDSATNQGQLATILNNSATTSANLKSASQDFRDLLDAAHKNQESLVRVLVSADSVMTRISNRSGTLGLLVSDSTLYRETTLTMIQLRQLLSDIQANPRKYFSFSVF